MQSSTQTMITQILKNPASKLFRFGLLLTLITLGACQPQNPISDNASQSIEPSVQLSVTPTHSTPNSATQKQSAVPSNTADLKTVKVFFSKIPNSNSDFNYVESVVRKTDRVDVAGFALEQLLLGPNNPESRQGLITPIELVGNSNCGGEDFKIGIDKGVAKLQFCRTLKTAGIGDDARIQTTLEKTLTQFPTIDSTIILDKNGNCLQNASGDNLCLAKNQKQVKVFFPKSPETNNDFTKVEPVIRTTTRSDVGSFAIEQLIAGPTATEKAKGFETPFPSFQGASNCNGKDFTLSISKQVGKLQFCRSVITAGIGQDIRIQNSIESTLKQFPTIKTVILLDQKGNCFNDASGENMCFSKL